jgi:hypothetical protein
MLEMHSRIVMHARMFPRTGEGGEAAHVPNAYLKSPVITITRLHIFFHPICQEEHDIGSSNGNEDFKY